MNRTWFHRECHGYVAKGRQLGPAAKAELLYGDTPLPGLYHLPKQTLETVMPAREITRAKDLIARRRSARAHEAHEHARAAREARTLAERATRRLK